MKKFHIRLYTGIAYVALLFIGINISAQTYSGGSGTQENPYEIATTGDLIYLSLHSDDWDKHFIQIADIVFNPDETQVDWDGDGILEHDYGGDDKAGFHPIGKSSTKYRGSYNGRGYIISNLYINGPEALKTDGFYAGMLNNPFAMFGCIEGAKIDSLVLIDIELIGRDRAASLVGLCSNSTLSNISIKGIVIGDDRIGGLVGESENSNITNCNASVRINGRRYTAGLVGYNSSTEITNCFSTSDVSGYSSVGGLIGRCSNNSTVSMCYSSGSVKGENYVGGLVGYNSHSAIIHSYATGGASGERNIGGFIGSNHSSYPISECYSTGSVIGITFAGGFLGNNSSTSILSSCYFNNETSNMQDNGIGLDENNQEVIGLTTQQFKDSTNFVGFNSDSIFWKFNSNSRPYLSWQRASVSNGVVENNRIEGYVLENGADIAEIGIRFRKYSHSNWTEIENRNSPGEYIDTLPFLEDGIYYIQSYAKDSLGESFYGDMVKLLLLPFDGSGTESAPYQIAEVGDLLFLSKNHVNLWDKHFIQTADIIFNDDETQVDWDGDGILEHEVNGEDVYGFSPIGSSNDKFSGIYNAQGFSIVNLFINSVNRGSTGLFGTTETAEIKNLMLSNCDITGWTDVGGIVGIARASLVTNCSITGSFKGYGRIGSIAGNSSSTIFNCFASGNIIYTGWNDEEEDDFPYNFGGLVGWNEGKVSHSFSNCYILGNYDNGGLIGFNAGKVTNCYATGSVIGYRTSGGLIGSNSGSVICSYATGSVAGSWETGGLIGDNFWKVSACYFDSVTSGTGAKGMGNDSNNQFVTSLSTEDFKDTTNFTGFTFDSLNWVENPNGRPYLYWQQATVSNGKLSNKIIDGYALETNTSIVEKGIRHKLFYHTNWTEIPDGKCSGEIIDTLENVSDGYFFIQAYAVDSSGKYYFGDMIQYIEIPYLGSGTEEDPYQIATTEDLISLSVSFPNLWDKHFIQTANITFNADPSLVDWDNNDTLEYNTGGEDINGFLPIGNEWRNFSGTYNGNGYYISNLYISRTSNNVGLFGSTYSAAIENLGIKDFKISGNHNVGGLAGQTSKFYYSTSTISNCYAIGELSGGRNIGGLVGNNEWTNISNCYTIVSIEGNTEIGGLIGRVRTTHISGCYSTGIIKGSAEVGGLVGLASEADIYNCYATGCVDGNTYCGGLVGYNGSVVEIYSCYATGSVIGNSKSGGFVGTEAYKITNCYFDKETTGKGDTGIGEDINNLTVTSLTTEEFKDSANFIGFTFDSLHWKSNANGRPYLYWQKAAISNGIVMDDSISGYALENGVNLIETGVRYREDTSITWIEQSTISGAGPIHEGIPGLTKGDIYLAYTYAKDDSGSVYYGDMVRFIAGRASQSITFPVPEEKTYNAPDFSLIATSSSGLPVKFTIPEDNGIIELSGENNDTVRIIGVGTVPITASQEGNDDFYKATKVTQSITINKATPLISEWPSASAITYGDSLDKSSLSGGTSDIVGNFSFTEPDSVPGAGINKQSVIFKPISEFYVSVEDSVFVSVNKADQSISFSPLENFVFGDSSFALEATASSDLDVTFSVPEDNHIVSLDGTNNEIVTMVSAGEITISAGQAGNENYHAAVDVDQILFVDKALPAISAWPTASEIIYGESLSESILIGGEASIAGNFAFKAPETIPEPGISDQSVIFTPIQLENYYTIDGMVSVTVNTTVSINSAANSNWIKVYPNPAKDNINIQLSEKYSNITLKLMSITGQVIWIKEYNTDNQLSIPIVEDDGLYLLEIHSNEGNRALIKIIKN